MSRCSGDLQHTALDESHQVGVPARAHLGVNLLAVGSR